MQPAPCGAAASHIELVRQTGLQFHPPPIPFRAVVNRAHAHTTRNDVPGRATIGGQITPPALIGGRTARTGKAAAVLGVDGLGRIVEVAHVDRGHAGRTLASDDLEHIGFSPHRHVDPLVVPAVDVEVNHLTRRGAECRPLRNPGRLGRIAIDHPLGHKVTGRKIVQLLEAQGGDHCIAVGVCRQLAKGGLQPVDQRWRAQAIGTPVHQGATALAGGRILVVDALNKPAAGGLGGAVVVTRLRQRDLHFVVAVAVANALKAVGLGDRGPDQLGHLHINHPVHLLGVAGDHLVTHGLGADHRHRDHAVTPDHRTSIEHHILTGEQVECARADGLNAVGAQLGGLEHVDRAGAQVVLKGIEFGLVALRTAGAGIRKHTAQTGTHIHLACVGGTGVDQAPDVHIAGSIEPDTVLRRQRTAGMDFVAAQMNPVVGTDHRRIEPTTLALDEQCLLGHHLHLASGRAGIQPGVGIQVDVLASHRDALLGIDIGVNLRLSLRAAGDGDRMDFGRKHSRRAGGVQLADCPFKPHDAAATDADGAALGRVNDGAAQSNGCTATVCTADLGGRQAIGVGDGGIVHIKRQAACGIHPAAVGVDKVGVSCNRSALCIHAVTQGAAGDRDGAAVGQATG